MTATGNRLVYLDGWRGLAIILVLIGHFTPVPDIQTGGFGPVSGIHFHPGRFGVELFFVLSGRLMAEILFVRGTDLLEFYRRRISRIVPGLFVFVLVYTVVFYLIEGRWLQANWIAGTLLFYSNYLVALAGHDAPALDHIWSLAVEEHSYIVLSLIMVACARRRRYTAAVLWTLVAGAIANGIYQTYFLAGGYFEVFWRSDVRMSSILISAALCVHFNNSPLQKAPANLFFVGLLGAVLNIDPVPDVIKYSVGTFCLALVVNLVDKLPSWAIRALSWRPLVIFGLASYSLYLWQQPFHKAIGGAGSSLLFLAGALCVGFVSYRFVEAPMRRWLNSLSLARPKNKSQNLVAGQASSSQIAVDVNAAGAERTEVQNKV